jgi:hypothetical protein
MDAGKGTIKLVIPNVKQIAVRLPEMRKQNGELKEALA